MRGVPANEAATGLTRYDDRPQRVVLLHLQVQEIAEQNWLVAVLASTAETHDSAKVIAL